MRNVNLFVPLAVSWLVSVAERSRLDLGKDPAQDGVIAVVVGHRHQELSLAHSPADIELLTKRASTPRVVQSARPRRIALTQVSGSMGDTTAPALSQLLRNESAQIHYACGMCRLLADQSAVTRRKAARSIGKGRKDVLPALGQLKALLQDSDKGVRRKAAWAIWQGGSKAILQAVDELKTSLQDPDARVRQEATWAIGMGDSEAVLQAVVELKASLQDADAGVRKNAALAIGSGGGKAVLQAVDELKASLQDTGDAEIRRNAASAIGSGGAEAVLQAVGELNASLQDTDVKVRRTATWAIGSGGRRAVLQTAGPLKASLQDADAGIRKFAAWAIGTGGAEAVLPAFSDLKAAIQDTDTTVRNRAAWAIGSGGPEAVLPAMGELKLLLQDKDAKTRGKAAWAIGRGGPEAVLQAVGELRALLQDWHSKPREKAAWAIGHGGSEAVLQAMGELKASLRDSDAAVRVRTAKTIGLGGGPAAVLQATGELEAMLQDADTMARKEAAKALRSAGADVVDRAAEYIRPSLDGAKDVEARKRAAEAVGMLGLAAIERTLPALRRMLREDRFARDAVSEARKHKISTSEAQPTQQIPAAAARAIEQYCSVGTDRVPLDLIPDLQQAHSRLNTYAMEFPLSADPAAAHDVEVALGAITRVMEDRCMNLFETQVDDLLLAKQWTVETPKGRMIRQANNIRSAGYGLQAHRCPNNAACPGEVLNVTYKDNPHTRMTGSSARKRANGTCPLARSSGEGAPCSEGYDSKVAGCAGCLEGWGRSPLDAFSCKKCGSVWLHRAAWLAHPSALLLLSMRSAKSVATRGDAAAFANDVLKITLSFSSSSVVIISSLGATNAYQELSKQTKEWLGLFSDGTQMGEAIRLVSPDCMLGRVLSLDELLALSFANPAIVLAVASLLLGICCIIRRWQSLDSTLAEDLMTLAVVSGNQYLPGVAAACAIAAPCYHTQTADVTGRALMAFSTSENCEERVRYLAMRAPVLALAFIAGPCLWVWLLRRDAGDGREQYVRYLTASYRPEHAGWEVNRLVRNMVLKCFVAVSPLSYCPGLQLTLVSCLMFSFTAWHLRNLPYKLGLLNNVEAISLWVLNLCLMASSLAVSGSWHLTQDFRTKLIISVFGLLSINSLGLASLFLWAKLMLHDDHELFKLNDGDQQRRSFG